MIDRRDWLIGAAGLVAATGAFALTPRHQMNLMGGRRLDRDLPDRVADWREDPGMAVVMPPSQGSLADRLYDQIFSRGYIRPGSSDTVMLFSSYGASQSDALQLHRPETCYPAVGFTPVSRRLTEIAIGKGVRLPVAELTMAYGDRLEDIVYWARIGDALPQDGVEQRLVRIEQSLRGNVLDGLLMRLSSARTAQDPPLHGAIAAFARDMLAAVDPAFLPALIGRTYARGLTG